MNIVPRVHSHESRQHCSAKFVEHLAVVIGVGVEYDMLVLVVDNKLEVVAINTVCQLRNIIYIQICILYTCMYSKHD